MTRVSVVVPACDAIATLPRCLATLRSEEPSELIVVDDGSQDGSAELARRCGARVLPSGGRRLGPASARNVGVAHATGDVVLFVDADVVVHAGVLDRVRRAFDDDGLVAVFGSYDDAPDHRGFASLYMNLRHHHFHQDASDDVPSFWAGLGAVRREPFQRVGGFDARSYALPSIEDIDLGVRLAAAGGRIRRDPTLQGKHLKRWTLTQVVRTDVFQRAVPWSRLMLRHPSAFGDLNVSRAERWKAVLAAALVVTIVLAALGLLPAWVPLLAVVGAWLANRPLVRVFVRGGGALFAPGALLFHQLYYLYGATTFVACALQERWRAQHDR